MKINQISGINFKTIMTNKTVLKGLEKISEHGTSFAAVTSLGMSLVVRPLAIFATPNVERENKEYASVSSISSGLVKFGMVEAVALPIENAVKRIDENPAKYLKKGTISSLAPSAGKITDAKAYRFGTQIIKLGAGTLSAVPKSLLTISLIPLIMDNLLHRKNQAVNLKFNNGKEFGFSNYKEIKEEDLKGADDTTKKLFNIFAGKDKKVPFTGVAGEKLSGGIAKILDNSYFQKFVKKFQNDEKNVAKHMTAATDILLTSSNALLIKNNKKIKENRKNPLIWNYVISTAATLGGGYFVDKIIKNKTQKFVDKFAKLNKSDPKLAKYIEGINILRPAIIFAGIYYGILPVISTYLAEKIDKKL